MPIIDPDMGRKPSKSIAKADPRSSQTPEVALTEATQAMIFAARLLPGWVLPGGRYLLTALVYLTDRSVGGRLPFDSFLRGPHSLVVEDGLERAVLLGQVALVTIRDGGPYDLLDGVRTEIRIHTSVKAPVKARREFVEPAQRMLRFAEAHPPFATTPWVIAAKLAWIRELEPSSSEASLESLAGQLKWANLDPAVQASGVALARALGRQFPGLRTLR